jgi:transcriptional regulator with XRE-family HTH domain
MRAGTPGRLASRSTRGRSVLDSITPGGLSVSSEGASRPKEDAPRDCEAEPVDLTPVVSANVKRIRRAKGISLASLARASGVSRAMLNQVEHGKSTPSINTLWRIARAFGIPFSTILSDSQEGTLAVTRAASSKVLSSRDGSFHSRPLLPSGALTAVGFYEIHLKPHSVERVEPRPLGSRESLVVANGSLTVVVGGRRETLTSGDSILFAADSFHEYWNEGDEPARAYLVMVYEEGLRRPLAPK